MSSKAKALLRALVGGHMLRLRAGQPVVPFAPADVNAEHGLGIGAAEIDAVAGELVTEGLCVWTKDRKLELTGGALSRTL